jgi:hypothetical protein
MAHILIRSDQIGPKSWDSQVFIITDKKQDFLLSFSGFLDDEKSSLRTFECHEVVLYKAPRAAEIKQGLGNQKLRRIEVTKELTTLIGEWIMQAGVLLSL